MWDGMWISISIHNIEPFNGKYRVYGMQIYMADKWRQYLLQGDANWGKKPFQRLNTAISRHYGSGVYKAPYSGSMKRHEMNEKSLFFKKLFWYL